MLDVKAAQVVDIKGKDSFVAHCSPMVYTF